MRYLRVKAGARQYLLPMEGVREILADYISAPILSSRSWLCGILYHQGRMFTQVDVSALGEEKDAGKIAILYEWEQEEVALMVSGIMEEGEGELKALMEAGEYLVNLGLLKEDKR